MKRWSITLLLALAVTLTIVYVPGSYAQTASPQPASDQPAPQIVGGVPAQPGAWPWQAALLYRGDFGDCGGSLIDINYILTAAHCVDDWPVNQLTIVLGEHDLTVNEGTEQTRAVSQIIIHPNYNNNTWANDIAILRLSAPATLSDRVRPVALLTTPQHDSLYTPGTTATATGWKPRSTHYGDLYIPTVLRQVEMPIVSNTTCNESANMVCVRLPEAGQDDCVNDGGGPLVVPNGAGSWLLGGILSGHGDCGFPNQYGVYTRVTNYQAWITSVIGLANTFRDAGVWNPSYGIATDLHFTGDFDGDGYGDIIHALSRINGPSKGLTWFVMKSNGSTFIDQGIVNHAYGMVNDRFYIADLNGDDKDDIVVATTRVNGPTNGLTWFWMRSTGTQFVDGGVINQAYGMAEDKFYVADLNGDNKDDIVVATTRVNGPTNGLTWFWMRSTGTQFVDGGMVNRAYGIVGDQVYIADWNGDHKDDLLLSTTRVNGAGNPLVWYWMRSNGTTLVDGGSISASWGLAGDHYFIGDFNGDGKDDLAGALSRINGDGTLRWYMAGSGGNDQIVDIPNTIWSPRYGAVGDIILVHNYRNSATISRPSADVTFAREVNGSLRWWVMFSDYTP